MPVVSIFPNYAPQVLRVANNSGSDMVAGNIVGLQGFDPTHMCPQILLAGSSPSSLRPMGVLGADIGDGDVGLMTLGPLFIHDIDVGAMVLDDKVYCNDGEITDSGDYYIGICVIAGMTGSVYIFPPSMMAKEA